MDRNIQFSSEVDAGERFEFGKNWSQFLTNLNEERIFVAIASIQQTLGISDLTGKTFLDVGSGSGLFSLAARRLGATVFSLDYDPSSVRCTSVLKTRFFPGDANWTVAQGSALDSDYLSKLGRFDIVYSWGVLHHTGQMWKALDNMVEMVKPCGLLCIAIYNDQGTRSLIWRRIKRLYNSAPLILRPAIAAACAARLWGPTTLRDFIRFSPFATWRTYTKQRGMSPWIDVVDWVGGYPFEVAKPEEIFDFYKARGFSMVRLRTCMGGLGCCEYVFARREESGIERLTSTTPSAESLS